MGAAWESAIAFTPCGEFPQGLWITGHDLADQAPLTATREPV
jgi:hypothetical protein